MTSINCSSTGPRARSRTRACASCSCAWPSGRGIEHRWSVLEPAPGGLPHDHPGGFYHGAMPATSTRMQRLRRGGAGAGAARRSTGCASRSRSTASPISSSRAAPASSRRGSTRSSPAGSASTGVERTLVGFMGCYAAVSRAPDRLSYRPLRARARGCWRSRSSSARSTSSRRRQLEQLLAMLQFSDGAAAALVTAEPGRVRDEPPLLDGSSRIPPS